MPTEMSIPFELSPDGSIAMVSDTFNRASQRVKAIVGTRPTQRVMDSTFGIPLDRMLFEPDDDGVELDVQEMVTEALATYEPGIIVEDVIAEASETGDGVSSVHVLFSLSEDPTRGSSQFVNTATIRPGGTVKEILRG